MSSVDRVKEICRNRNIPISKLERDLGFANGYIGQLRKGVFPDDRLLKIAEYLEVSTDYLLGVSDIKNPPPQNEREVLLNALFDGDKSVTEDMMDEVKGFARYVREREKNRTKDE